MQVAGEETFGPLASVLVFDDDLEVIERANSTETGLAAYLYSRDLNRVFNTMEQLEFGMVGVNTGSISSEPAPFGGIKESENSREGSHHGLHEFTELKYICIGGLCPRR